MKLNHLIKNPHDRIIATHFLVIIILIVNITFFTTELISFVIQSILIVAVFLHNKDDYNIWNELQKVKNQLQEDSDIFNRNVIVSESDVDGNITYVNENFCDITGYAKDELLGKPHSLLRSPNTPTSMYNKLWKTIQNNETFHATIENRKKDGSLFWTDSSISPIRSDNKTIGYKAIRFDTTKQALAHEGLQSQITEQAKRFEFAINSSRDGFWDYNLKENEFYLSASWKHRLGFQEDEKLKYLDYLALIPNNSRSEHHTAIHDILEDTPNESGYAHFRIRYPITTKNGEKLIIEDVGDAFFENGETPTRITGFHRDITEKEHQAKMLESQNRMSAMGEMLGNIAHQWRQPIGAINNTLNDLEFDIELEDLEQIDSQTFLNTSKKVKEYTAHLSQTIDDFRTMSSNEKSKSQFLLQDVLQEAYEIISSSYKKNNIDINFTGAKECQCEIYGYKRELLQVILNILNNAQDVLIDKKIQVPLVQLLLSENEQSIYIMIHDNGGGIPEAIINKIFDPYFTTKHESVGTGIGLYMSKKIITTHFNGTLEVMNENDGAKFIIEIPKDNKSINK